MSCRKKIINKIGFCFFLFFFKKIETINDKINIIKMLNNNDNNYEFNIALEDLKIVSKDIIQKIKKKKLYIFFFLQIHKKKYINKMPKYIIKKYTSTKIQNI